MELHTRKIEKGTHARSLGEIVWLFSNSEIHRSWSIFSIHQWMLPPLKNEQCLIYLDGDKPVGVITWAYMSQNVEQKYVQSTTSLMPSDWKSGDRLWGIDFVAPFGHASVILDDLRRNVFADVTGRFLRTKIGDETIRIMYAHGKNSPRLTRARSSNAVLSETDKSALFLQSNC